VKNFADAMGLGEHAPNFSRYPVKIEIGTGLQTQNDDATVYIGRRQLPALNKDAIVCDTQGCGLHYFAVTQQALCIDVVELPTGVSDWSTRSPIDRRPIPLQLGNEILCFSACS
jgi:hypothetical protein